MLRALARTSVLIASSPDRDRMNIHDASLFRTSDWSGEGSLPRPALLLLTIKSLATSGGASGESRYRWRSAEPFMEESPGTCEDGNP